MQRNHILDLTIKYAKSMGYQIKACQVPLDYNGGSMITPTGQIAAKMIQLPMFMEGENVLDFEELMKRTDEKDQLMMSLKFNILRLYRMGKFID